MANLSKTQAEHNVEAPIKYLLCGGSGHYCQSTLSASAMASSQCVAQPLGFFSSWVNGRAGGAGAPWEDSGGQGRKQWQPQRRPAEEKQGGAPGGLGRQWRRPEGPSDRKGMYCPCVYGDAHGAGATLIQENAVCPPSLLSTTRSSRYSRVHILAAGFCCACQFWEAQSRGLSSERLPQPDVGIPHSKGSSEAPQHGKSGGPGVELSWVVLGAGLLLMHADTAWVRPPAAG
jgi:hypothetical protein